MCVCVWKGASWDLMNTNQPLGERGCGLITTHLHLCVSVCVCVCVWWRRGWLTGPTLDGPLHDIWWGLTNYHQSTCNHMHTHSHIKKQQLSPFYRVVPRYHPPPPSVELCQSHTNMRCMVTNDVGCLWLVNTETMFWWIGHIFTITPQRC